LQSDLHLDLLDVENTKAIVSNTQNPNPASKNNNFLVTMRPEKESNRLEVKMRTTEGQSGELECLVFQKDCGVCQSFYLPIKALSLHERVSDFKEDPEKVQMSQINMKGSFAKTDINAWLSVCLLDVPQRVDDEDSTLIFRSVFSGSHLICKYNKGFATCKSDSITTLAILKDCISREAAQRKINVDVSSALNDECSFKLLELLHPKILKLHNLKQQVEVLEALKELKLQQEQEKASGDMAFSMPSEFSNTLDRSDQILKEYKAEPRKLEYIYGIIEDLFMDRAKVLGIQNAEAKIAALEGILHSYDYQKLIDLFKSTSK